MLADIPGLIEGASDGRRARATSSSPTWSAAACSSTWWSLAPLDGSDPVANHATVEAELRDHGHGLAELPRILCLSKADLVPAGEAERLAAEWRERLGVPVVVSSAATGAGLGALRDAVFERVPPEPPRAAGRRAAGHPPCLPPGRGRRLPGGAASAPAPSASTAGAIERLIARHDIDNDEALRYVEERLRALGVIKALEAAGFEPGDDVEIAGIVFELDPGAPFG